MIQINSCFKKMNVCMHMDATRGKGYREMPSSSEFLKNIDKKT